MCRCWWSCTPIHGATERVEVLRRRVGTATRDARLYTERAGVRYWNAFELSPGLSRGERLTPLRRERAKNALIGWIQLTISLPPRPNARNGSSRCTSRRDDRPAACRHAAATTPAAGVGAAAAARADFRRSSVTTRGRWALRVRTALPHRYYDLHVTVRLLMK